jgi:hypothetical protein
MNTYLVRVSLAFQSDSQDYTIQANSTDQAESQVWDLLEQSGQDEDVMMFDTSRLFREAA